MLSQIILGVLLVMLLVMMAAWIVGLATKDGGWTDVFWTLGTGAVLVATALTAGSPLTPTPRQWLVVVFIGAWALRLGAHLIWRKLRNPEESRYTAARAKWGGHYPARMLGVVLPLAAATSLLALSVAMAAGRAEAELGVRDILAVVIVITAIMGETLADIQLAIFRSDPANRGALLEHGLWAWSRHPNYFFQWLGWLAYPVIAFDMFRPETVLSFTAPVVMYMLLRYVSGVPLVEAALLGSRGEQFRAYQQRVSVFFPGRPY